MKNASRDSVYLELYDYISNCPVINTHCHHLSDQQIYGANLDFVLTSSYSGWMSNPPKHDKTSVLEYLNANGCNSYYRWLFEGIKSLYGLEVNADTFPEIDSRITRAYRDSNYHLSVLKNICGYERVLLDKYDDPGSDNGHPEIFTPVFRINMYIFGYSRDMRDHNGNSPYDRPGFKEVRTFEDFIGAMLDDVQKVKSKGAVALKNAAAYDRNLNFNRTSKEHAKRAFGKTDATSAEIKHFQDYIIFELAQAAQDNGLVMQVHTGLGLLDGTNPMELRQMISEFPALKFDIFHAGYPWTGEALALLHNYPNTYVNICWLPLISTREAKDFIIKALEISSAKRICWGCDTWTSEESLGAVLALRHVLTEALAEMVQDGAFDTGYAKYIANRILYANAKELYGL